MKRRVCAVLVAVCSFLARDYVSESGASDPSQEPAEPLMAAELSFAALAVTGVRRRVPRP